jgi:hypothetical protein
VGVFIDKGDNIYVADSESESVAKNHDGWRRGIRVGSAKDATATALIPDPVEKITGTSAAEGVAAESMGEYLRRRSMAETLDEIHQKMIFNALERVLSSDAHRRACGVRVVLYP